MEKSFKKVQRNSTRGSFPLNFCLMILTPGLAFVQVRRFPRPIFCFHFQNFARVQLQKLPQLFRRQRVTREVTPETPKVGVGGKNFVADETDELTVLVGEVRNDQVVGQFLDSVDVDAFVVVSRHIDGQFDVRASVFEQDVLVEQEEVVDDDAEELQHVVEHVLSEEDLVAFGQNLDHE